MHSELKSKFHVDIIGDLHGCYHPLQTLLDRLGYQKRNGIWQHPTRMAIFVGDLIDRGPNIRETLQLVYNMYTTGNALVVLGNHEINAIRYRDEIAVHLDQGTNDQLPERLLKLMRDTLQQFRGYSKQWLAFADWFSTLPLFLEGEGFRVVHACWDEVLINQYKQKYPIESVSGEFISAAQEWGSPESRTLDRLTRGTSMPLPDGMQLESNDGYIRRFFRTKFWAHSPVTYGDVVFQPDPLPFELAEHPITQEHKERLVSYPTTSPPVFIGHYWMTGRPRPLQPNIACLDYSAVNFGRLTAYSFDGEPTLSEEKFTWVYVERC